MFDLDRWQEILIALRKNKLRTILTAFGVFWGIFMLIIMLGSGHGLQNGVTQGFGDFSTNSVFIWTQKTSIPYKGFPRGRQFYFENDDVDALRKNIPEIEYIAPRIQAGGFMGGDNVVRGLRSGAYSIFGDYPEINNIDPVSTVSGRFINELDLQDKRKVVVIGSMVSDALFKPGENPIGDYIRIQGVYFQVVGIFKSKKIGEEADHENQTIYMPFTTLQKTYNYGNIVGYFSITSKKNVPVSVVEEKAIELLKSRHSVAPEDDMAMGHFNVEKEFNKMNGLFKGISTLIWIVGFGTLLAGVIGVSNIMLVIVKERTKEIGIQRAIGATPFRVISQIITESVFLTSLAGYLGLAAGVGMLSLVNSLMTDNPAQETMFKNPEIDFRIAVIALLILIVSGTFAGFVPAKRAVSIKPIDALRYE
ncbi:MAG: multidrug ABC transporter ATP-binding protein [Candidatus Schekmanbacteria bacterium RBG_13_48_7]|uniref:Multidrug ABC transporter ATP-binding protein n=1 Tax=Candidatus Schekmanbacteria bacterium RBG_13_48_7 TaxID=1817878 RepID=A0A1F7RME1_9BACT|nr:MAG: multidrug ABC transporter ATP-binding protein [Candidatus Schekmanbacteria bacterium RBG_13_48_7]